MDVNGDGLLDRVMTIYGNSGTTYFLVQTNIGPFPDLLTTVSNGIGGRDSRLVCALHGLG